MLNKIKLVAYHIYVYLFKYKSLHMYWFKEKHNFGDHINIYIVSKLSGKSIQWIHPKYSLKKNYLCIGSVLGIASSNTIVWGSGLIDGNIKKLKKPKQICAVRGPKTRQILNDHNIKCPEIYGDPALLLPRFYNPRIEKKYKVGVILHYVDKSMAYYELFNNEDIKVIDIQQNQPMNFIDELLECELIISSSLHGLIVSDAYGVPSIWVKLSNNILGNDFKFYDYFESVKRLNEKPIEITSSTHIEDILKFKKNYKIDIDLDRLMEVCPFNHSRDEVDKV